MTKLFHSVAPLVGAHFSIGPRWLNYATGLAACLSMLVPLAASAQAPGHDPFDPRTVATVPVYESAFSGYQAYQEPEIMSWKTANDVVREFGSMAAMKGGGSAHAGHSSTDSEKAEPSAPDSHAGHSTPAPSPAAAPAKSKPDDMKSMPGHDMSKMPQAAPSGPAKSSPAPQPAAPAKPQSMPGHGGMHH